MMPIVRDLAHCALNGQTWSWSSCQVPLLPSAIAWKCSGQTARQLLQKFASPCLPDLLSYYTISRSPHRSVTAKRASHRLVISSHCAMVSLSLSLIISLCPRGKDAAAEDPHGPTAAVWHAACACDNSEVKSSSRHLLPSLGRCLLTF